MNKSWLETSISNYVSCRLLKATGFLCSYVLILTERTLRWSVMYKIMANQWQQMCFAFDSLVTVRVNNNRILKSTDQLWNYLYPSSRIEIRDKFSPHGVSSGINLQSFNYYLLESRAKDQIWGIIMWTTLSCLLSSSDRHIGIILSCRIETSDIGVWCLNNKRCGPCWGQR